MTSLKKFLRESEKTPVQWFWQVQTRRLASDFKAWNG